MSFKHIAFIGMVAISLSGTYLVSASAATNTPVILRTQLITTNLPTVLVSTTSVGTTPNFFLLGATSSIGAPITYSANSKNTACNIYRDHLSWAPFTEVGSWYLQLNTAGICNVTIFAAGTSQYSTTSVAVPVEILLAQNLVGDPIGRGNPVTMDQSPLNLVSSATSGLPITYKSNSLSICSINGSLLILLNPGICSIDVSQNGNSTYQTITKNLKITVVKADQLMIVNFTPANPLPKSAEYFYGHQFPVAISATATSGLTVSITSLTPKVCDVESSTKNLIMLAQAEYLSTCTLQFYQAGNFAWNPTSSGKYLNNNFFQYFSVNLYKSSQAITLTAPPSFVFSSKSAVISATATSGLPVIITSLTPSVCRVVGNQVNALIWGQCQIAANQSGNTMFTSAAQVTKIITIKYN